MFALILPLIAKFGLGALSSFKEIKLKKIELDSDKDGRKHTEHVKAIDAEISRLNLVKELQVKENEYWTYRIGKVGFIWASLFWYGALVYNQVFKDIHNLTWKVYTVPTLEYVLYAVVGYLFLKTTVKLWSRK